MKLVRFLQIFLIIILLSFIFSIPSFSYIVGDADNDGKITSSDARIALRISAKLESYRVQCDLNNDRKVNSDEARKILKVAAKQDQFNFKGYTVPYHTYINDSINYPCIWCNGFYTMINTVRSKNNLKPIGSKKDDNVNAWGIDTFSKMKTELKKANAKNIKDNSFIITGPTINNKKKYSRSTYINDIKNSLKSGKVVIIKNSTGRTSPAQDALGAVFYIYHPEWRMLLYDGNDNYPAVIDSLGRIHRMEYSYEQVVDMMLDVDHAEWLSNDSTGYITFNV